MTHVRFDRAALSDALAIAGKVKAWAPPRWTSIQIPKGGTTETHWRPGPPMVEIVATGDRATIRAANHDRQVLVTIPCEGETSVLVPMGTLHSWVAKLNSGRVDLNVDGETAAFTSARLRATLRCAPMGHYPPLREAPRVAVATLAELRAGFDATVAVPKDGGPVEQGGVHMRGEPGALRFFATQHGRIHERQAGGAAGANIIVPVDTARLFLALFDGENGEIEIGASDRAIAFRGGDVRLVSSVLDGGAVSGDTEFERPRPNTLRAHADDLLTALDLVTTVSDPKHGDFELRLGATCEAYAKSAGGKDQGIVALSAEWSGAPMAITFALKPVRDALLLFGGSEIEWRMGGALETTTIALAAGGEVRALVAPYLPREAAPAKGKAA